MQTIHEYPFARVVEVGMLAHVQTHTPSGWRTVREFLPQFDTLGWDNARSYAEGLSRKAEHAQTIDMFGDK